MLLVLEQYPSNFEHEVVKTTRVELVADTGTFIGSSIDPSDTEYLSWWLQYDFVSKACYQILHFFFFFQECIINSRYILNKKGNRRIVVYTIKIAVNYPILLPFLRRKRIVL